MWDQSAAFLAGPVEFSTGEIALLLAILLAPSLACGIAGAWWLARRHPEGRRWAWALLGFVCAFVFGLSVQWFGTTLF